MSESAGISSSIRIKVGPIELECVASEAFLETQVPNLIASAVQLLREDAVRLDAPGELEPTGGGVSKNGINNGPNGKGQLTTSSVAAKLKVKSGPELILAACLRLTRAGTHPLSRSEILKEMKSASGYFKQTYVNNLSKYLNTLVASGKLLEQAKDSYALDVTAQNELEARLVQR